MRRTLEAISIGSVVVLVVLTVLALFGPDRLPGRVAIHFDLAGHPNGWGSPLWMLVLPAIGVGLYALLTTVVRFPSAFNYPVPVTAENRPRLEALTVEMIAWLKAEILLNFLWLQWGSIEVARHPERGMSMLPVFGILVATAITAGWFIRAMFHVRGGTEG